MVSGYDKRPPEPRYRPGLPLGWPFVAGVAVAAVVVALILTF
jgi:hypothetical protein